MVPWLTLKIFLCEFPLSPQPFGNEPLDGSGHLKAARIQSQQPLANAFNAPGTAFSLREAKSYLVCLWLDTNFELS